MDEQATSGVGAMPNQQKEAQELTVRELISQLVMQTEDLDGLVYVSVMGMDPQPVNQIEQSEDVEGIVLTHS